MELDELQKELQKYKDLRDKAIKDGADFGWINDTIASLEQKIAALPQPAETAAPDPVLEEIVLPGDYNVIFGDPRANEEITNLIRQVKAQLVMDHSLALERVFEEHKQKLTELQENHEIQIQLVTNDKLEAEGKRDNAIGLKEAAENSNTRLIQENKSLNEQVDELEGLLQSFKKPVASHGLSLTTTLQPETDDEKQARLAKEKTDLLNKNLSRFNVDPLPTKVELVTVDQLDDSFRKVAASEAVVPNESGGDRVQETAAPLEQAEDGASKLAIEQQLYADVTGLKEQMRIVFDRLELH